MQSVCTYVHTHLHTYAYVSRFVSKPKKSISIYDVLALSEQADVGCAAAQEARAHLSHSRDPYVDWASGSWPSRGLKKISQKVQKEQSEFLRRDRSMAVLLLSLGV